MSIFTILNQPVAILVTASSQTDKSESLTCICLRMQLRRCFDSYDHLRFVNSKSQILYTMILLLSKYFRHFFISDSYKFFIAFSVREENIFGMSAD